MSAAQHLPRICAKLGVSPCLADMRDDVIDASQTARTYEVSAAILSSQHAVLFGPEDAEVQSYLHVRTLFFVANSVHQVFIASCCH